jgi:hypothetical protein
MMTAQKKELAVLVYQLRRMGIKADEYVTVPEGIFFKSLKSARLVAKKYDRVLTRIDEQVSGWLVKKES